MARGFCLANFENYYRRKIKQGRVEPFFEKYAMRLMGVQKLCGSA